MIIGNINKINLSISSFERIINDGNLYVDKTRLIEHFLETPSTVQLVARQRRLGKSLNMDTIRCFLTDRKDLRHLFKGLYIESSPVWEKAHSAPVFYFDFKALRPGTYRDQVIDTMIDHICAMIEPENLDFALKRKFHQIIESPERASESLLFLTEVAYKLTGKNAYLLIDEYDKLLMENFDSPEYEAMRKFETALLSSALKGNPYLEKALLTGVMRISHESMLSGLNNIVTFDVFKDNVYTTDYGLTDTEMTALHALAPFDMEAIRNWYNGIRIGGQAIHNIYSVMSYLSDSMYAKGNSSYDCYWGKSGTLDMIIHLLNDQRRLTLAKLLGGNPVQVQVDNRISLQQLDSQKGDEAFFSLLIQAGYLALNDRQPSGTSTVTIPNKELMIVWKNFILSRFYTDATQVRTLFDHTNNLTLLEQDIAYFLSERLSYHDLSLYKGENIQHVQERAYHIYILGLLSAHEDMRFRYPLSNRESGDGRYDILVETPNAHYIFELKTSHKNEDLAKDAAKALAQIETKRYGADLATTGKKLIKIGVALWGKQCKVKCG